MLNQPWGFNIQNRSSGIGFVNWTPMIILLYAIVLYIVLTFTRSPTSGTIDVFYAKFNYSVDCAIDLAAPRLYPDSC